MHMYSFTVQKTCGDTTNFNNTYFTSNGIDEGVCTLTVCKANDNICALRIDFHQFELAQPARVGDLDGM